MCSRLGKREQEESARTSAKGEGAPHRDPRDAVTMGKKLGKEDEATGGHRLAQAPGWAA